MSGETTGQGTHKYDRVPFIVLYEEHSAIKEVYAGRMGFVSLECHSLQPRGVPKKTVLIFMHPTGVMSYLPMPVALAKNGWHVITAASRYPHNDSALIFEKVAADLGAIIRHAKEKMGYENVVLCGWSGGGSLSMFYQSNAEKPRFTHTPAGDPYDLTAMNLIKADGVMQLAAHVSRHRTLTEWIDPAVTDEANPEKRDTSLDLYAADGPQAPYGEAFIEKFRAAQIARNRRITAWVKERLEHMNKKGIHDQEYGFTVHCTMADPKWLDPRIDPNGRKARWCFMGDPKSVNESPAGLARFSHLRSWLSQWSYDDARADGPTCGADISVPVLVVENTADDACTPSHTQRIFAGVKHADKELKYIQGANHYYFGQPDKMAESVAVQSDWLKRKGF